LHGEAKGKDILTSANKTSKPASGAKKVSRHDGKPVLGLSGKKGKKVLHMGNDEEFV